MRARISSMPHPATPVATAPASASRSSHQAWVMPNGGAAGQAASEPRERRDGGLVEWLAVQVVDGIEEVAERGLVGHVVGVGARVGQGLGVGTGHLLDGVHRGFPARRCQGGDEVLDPGLLGGAHHHGVRAPVAPDAGGV